MMYFLDILYVNYFIILVMSAWLQIEPTIRQITLIQVPRQLDPSSNYV